MWWCGKSQEFRKWVSTFALVACCIVFFFAVYRFDIFSNLIVKLLTILKPFIYGLVMAYLLCPVYNYVYKKTYYGFWKNVLKKNRAKTAAKVVTSIATLSVLIIVVGGLIVLIIPGMIESVIKITMNLPENVQATIEFLQNRFAKIPTGPGPVADTVTKMTDNFVSYIQNDMLPKYTTIFSSVSAGVFGAIVEILNFIIGAIISIFFLNSKEVFSGQSKKLVFALFSEYRARRILLGATFTNKTFSKFINGKVIDSILVGLICFVFMNIMNWPYPILISSIIAVTNIIPFFGPFIGAIPATLLLLIEDPIICIYFIFFVLVLQLFDGYILGPKILGGTTGLPSFWVMFAILVGGGLFGFIGMIVGVPLFAIVFAYTAYGINNKLEAKGYTIDLEQYKNMKILKEEDINIDIIKENDKC